MAWGYHLILDCGGCNKNINSESEIKNFITDLITKIDMDPVGDPIIKYLLPGTNNSGYSVIQLIQTSNITIHFVDTTGEAYFDVFSCKNFDKNVAIDTVKYWFDPKTIKETLIERNA
jgi:S-adenosylmethionine/arginine decarboxylase-like enzyme